MEKQILDALSQSNAGIALFDANERLIFANPAWNQLITGIAEDDLVFDETSLDNGGMLSVCLVRPHIHASELRPSIADVENHKRGTVLVADDSASNRMVARRMLQAEGFTVMEAGDGQSVLDILRRGIPVDVILMDVEMPDMDGLHTTRRIRHMDGPSSRIPIIAFSAHRTRDWNMIARQSGVNDFISKPIQRASLLRVIGENLLRNGAAGQKGDIPAPAPVARMKQTNRTFTSNQNELPASPVLDVKILEKLYHDAGIDGAATGIELFISETESRLVQIDDALSRYDFHAVRDEVHALKSTSDTFGLRQLADLCNAAHDLFDRDDIDEHHLIKLSRKVVQLAPTALTALNLYRRSRSWAMT
ncbi:Hpt domain-containing response regulator [Thalassospira marina]|uniref:Histidine kinase n=1 Tax=Thalassospira marina TaxID=2048283 RepID=A0A2N3KWD1_9PROT|nr:response regulator [Thalassospira marina]AUG53735.1 histidine kinase [Thalassospira marina]PKR54882.1 histidine kinase [Thalassospira marina]